MVWCDEVVTDKLIFIICSPLVSSEGVQIWLIRRQIIKKFQQLPIFSAGKNSI